VKADRKWEELFYECYAALGYSGEGAPNAARAWDLVVAAIVAGKQALHSKHKKWVTLWSYFQQIQTMYSMLNILFHIDFLVLILIFVIFKFFSFY